MKVERSKSAGLRSCQDALQRILDGNPLVAAHVGLDLSQLTASMVSYEAGFDRGYLKKSRSSHLPILAKIESARHGSKLDTGAVTRARIRALEQKNFLQEQQVALLVAQRDRVLEQNLKLWEQLRELADSISRKGLNQAHYLFPV